MDLKRFKKIKNKKKRNEERNENQKKEEGKNRKEVCFSFVDYLLNNNLPFEIKKREMKREMKT
jgi:hypothetical protein